MKKKDKEKLTKKIIEDFKKSLEDPRPNGVIESFIGKEKNKERK